MLHRTCHFQIVLFLKKGARADQACASTSTSSSSSSAGYVAHKRKKLYIFNKKNFPFFEINFFFSHFSSFWEYSSLLLLRVTTVEIFHRPSNILLTAPPSPPLPVQVYYHYYCLKLSCLNHSVNSLKQNTRQLPLSRLDFATTTTAKSLPHLILRL